MYKVKIANLIIDILDNDDSFKFFFEKYIINTNELANITINNTKDLFTIHNEIASNLSHFKGFLIHGACIKYKNEAYLFIAPSGTGKTTHIKMWMDKLNVKVINGDKPVVRLIENCPIIFGSPWCGKENYGENINSKLKAIIILQRSPVDKMKLVQTKDYIQEIFKQLYIPENNNDVLLTLDLVNEVFKQVPVYKLECTKEETAFLTSFKALTGEEYESK